MEPPSSSYLMFLTGFLGWFHHEESDEYADKSQCAYRDERAQVGAEKVAGKAGDEIG